MGDRVATPRESIPLPEVVVLYTPESPMLAIQAGESAVSRIHESEPVANFMVASYDRNNSLVALDLIDCAEDALKPLLDAALPKDEKNSVNLSTSTAAWSNTEDFFGTLPDVVVFYTPETQALRIQAGNPVHIHKSETVANGMVAHYNDNRSLVALDLEAADKVLKPFLDAVRHKEQAKMTQAG